MGQRGSWLPHTKLGLHEEKKSHLFWELAYNTYSKLVHQMALDSFGTDSSIHLGLIKYKREELETESDLMIHGCM